MWLWTGVQSANKLFSVIVFVWIKNVRWLITNLLLCPSSCSFSFSSLALIASCLFHFLPTVFFLSISSRFPPSYFSLFPPRTTHPPPFFLLKNSSWYGASLSSSLTTIHSINQLFYGWFWPLVFFALKDLCWIFFPISFWNLETCC